MLWSLHSCTVLESLCSLPFEVLSYAYTAIIIERIFAFKLSETYEKQRNIVVVFILAGITVSGFYQPFSVDKKWSNSNLKIFRVLGKIIQIKQFFENIFQYVQTPKTKS